MASSENLSCVPKNLMSERHEGEGRMQAKEGEPSTPYTLDFSKVSFKISMKCVQAVQKPKNKPVIHTDLHLDIQSKRLDFYISFKI